MTRNYKKEYKKFQSSSSSKKDRAYRNKLRRLFLKLKKVKKGDNKDIDHKLFLKSLGHSEEEVSNSGKRKELYRKYLIKIGDTELD